MSLMNHEAGRKCLLEIDDILKEYKLGHFLLQGTALGAYRDHGFVPTEKDIDIGILQENLQPHARCILNDLIRLGYDIECFQMPFTQPRTLVAFKSYLIDNKVEVVKVDIVGLIKWKDKRFTATPIRGYNAHEPYAIVHDARMLEEYRCINLFGREFYIPSQIELYLELEYGPDWRIPVEDHVSRTRIYNFVEDERIPRGYLEQF